ncbi:MAG: hypothetical protein ACRD4X_17450 [Candidatus Acidiferrales bacterium]
MPQTALTIDGTLRVLRVIYAALVSAIVFYAWIPGGMLHIAVQPIDRALYVGIAVVAVLSAVMAVVMRNRMLQPALATLRTNPADAASHRRWRTGSLVSYSLALAVVLYGFALRMIGATFGQAAPFYAVGFALMLLWWPRRP